MDFVVRNFACCVTLQHIITKIQGQQMGILEDPAFDLIAVRGGMVLNRAKDWTLAQDERLIKLHDGGASYAMIGMDLGKSRSAICGRIRRLRLAQPGGQITRADRRRYQFGVKNRALAVYARPAPVEPINANPLHVVFADLERGMCRWPYGDGPFTFCGASIQEGSSYCCSHHNIAWVEPKKRWRAAA